MRHFKSESYWFPGEFTSALWLEVIVRKIHFGSDIKENSVKIILLQNTKYQF